MQEQTFSYKVTPGPKCTAVQFAQLIKLHIEHYCGGLSCDNFCDWDGKTLFWRTDPFCDNPETEKEVWNGLHFYARRFLKENDITEPNLSKYVQFKRIP